jgi:hypothetical protein
VDVHALLEPGEAIVVEKTITVPSKVVEIPGDAVYTLDADFARGSAINVVPSTPDQLQLDETTKAFPSIWVAASSRGTIVKIDTATGDILGE